MNTLNSASHNFFSGPRFLRVLSNDLAWQWKRLWIGTLAMMGIGLMIYLTNVNDAHNDNDVEFYKVLFPLALLGGGLLLASTIFADLHHPLQRFHYLTLPCSNLERFLSRYLLTGPLYFLYVLVAYLVFDEVAAVISNVLMHKRAASFSLTQTPLWQLSLVYFLMHSVALLGAVYFRSFSLIKTALAGTLLSLLIGVVQTVAIRLIYWDYFDGFLPSDNGLVIPAPLFITRPMMFVGIAFLLHLWVLYMAYVTLCDHEVQDEL